MKNFARTALGAMALILGWMLATHAGPEGVFLLANGALLMARKKDLQKLLKDAAAIEKRYEPGDDQKSKQWSAEDAKSYGTLLDEAEAMQSELDNLERKAKLEEKFGRIRDPVLPPDDPDPKQKTTGRIHGYLSLGALTVLSKKYAEAFGAGFPQGLQMNLIDAEEIHRKGAGRVFVPLTREMRVAVEEAKSALESKAVPTVGADVIPEDRLSEVVRVTEHDDLRLRDILNVSPTSSPVIRYVRIASYTRAAAPVADQLDTGTTKPEASLELDSQTAEVKTIAVWMPVTEQQLQDVPQLSNMIDTELLYDLSKVEEEQVIYGDGLGDNLTGVMSSGISLGRTVSGDTSLDLIRRMMTDVRRSGYIPNGVAIDPIDWEDIVLLKGTDDHYLRQVFPSEEGILRVWAMGVVETVAMEDAATGERNMIVADWIRGATLWDRLQQSIAIGWINDQFIRNQRTIRAEERVAFAVKRALAFRYRQTNAPTS